MSFAVKFFAFYVLATFITESLLLPADSEAVKKEIDKPATEADKKSENFKEVKKDNNGSDRRKCFIGGCLCKKGEKRDRSGKCRKVLHRP